MQQALKGPTQDVLRVAPAVWLEEMRALVDARIRVLLSMHYPQQGAMRPLSEATAYAALSGGKRLRPLLALAAIERYRPIDDAAVAFSVAPELIHAATLVLDDLPSMDDAQLRRGKPASHLVFGESTTILAALGLWSEAVRIVGESKALALERIVGEIAEAVGVRGLVGGQFLDLSSCGKEETLEAIENLSYRKTGALIRAAVVLGALYAEAPGEELRALGEFGRAYGELYQMRDDLIDALSTEKEAGKDVGADAKKMRPTFVTALGVEGARRLLAEKRDEARRALAELPGGPGRLAVFIDLAEPC